jgi:hypothetical protein
MDYFHKMTVDEANIKNAVLSGIPLIISTYTLPRETEIYIESVVTAFLRLAGKEKFKDYILYCVQELTANAKKANTKRVYFMEHGLDISNPGDYQKGMEQFKEDTLNNITHYLQMQENMGLYIKLFVQIRENTIYFEIRNNVVVTRTELTRIQDRIARARQYKTLDEALAQVMDDSEGAGLGIVILVLMLHKMGLGEDSFAIFHTNNETIARIMVPLDHVYVEK